MDKNKRFDMIQGMLNATKKARSNIIEVIAVRPEPSEAELTVLEFLHPKLFGQPPMDTLSLMQIYADKAYNNKFISGADLYNAICFFNQEPVLPLTYSLLFNEDLPSGRDLIGMIVDNGDIT